MRSTYIEVVETTHQRKAILYHPDTAWKFVESTRLSGIDSHAPVHAITLEHESGSYAQRCEVADTIRKLGVLSYSASVSTASARFLCLRMLLPAAQLHCATLFARFACSGQRCSAALQRDTHTHTSLITGASSYMYLITSITGSIFHQHDIVRISM